MKMLLIAAAVLPVAACHKDRPPAPTEEQSAQLNEMESALNDMGENQQTPENRTRNSR